MSMDWVLQVKYTPCLVLSHEEVLLVGEKSSSTIAAQKQKSHHSL